MKGAASRHPKRREFLYVATGAVAATGLGIAAWPFLAHLDPDASIPAPVEFDLSILEEGEQAYVRLGDEMLIARRRTPSEFDATRAVAVNSLRDPLARNSNLPADAPAIDENRTIMEFREFTIVSAHCSKEGCVLVEQSLDSTMPGLWQCACCGSHYDSVGRVVWGPAPMNLRIPILSNPSGLRLRLLART